jgi:hypothetical protein
VPAPNPSLDDWYRATVDLVPRGILWSRDRLSNFGKLISTIAQERQLRHQRKLILLQSESVPTTSVEGILKSVDWAIALCAKLNTMSSARHRPIAASCIRRFK